MKSSAKSFLKKQAIILLTIVFITLITVIVCLGFYEKNIEPLEKTTTISVSPKK